MRWTQEAINSTIWSLGCDWFHCQWETSDPAVSPDDDSRMVSTPWGKRRENKASASRLPASLPEIWGGGEMAQFRKPLPIVLLPSLVVVSTVRFAMRVPLFLFCCTPADLSALMF